MGGKVLCVSLMLAILGMGCEREARRESAPVYASKPKSRALRESKACTTDTEILELRNKCFDSIEKRDKTIEELKAEIVSLQEQVKYAKENEDDWRKRYNDYHCD
jgi:hypothetical protein